MDANIIKKANDIVNSCTEGYVALMDEDSYPHAATRSVRNADGIFSCYFTTGTKGNMAKAITINSKASICFRKDNDNVTLIGDFKIITDMKTKQDVWVDWFVNHYLKGACDPNYFVVKFTSKHVSFWIDKKGTEFDIADINKPQSRCGLLCDGCSFKESHNCGGCIETNGHPFHGECPIAGCCQDKGYTHCGECDIMPCDKLHEYSCGEGEHCDVPKGARLEMLQYWKKNDYNK